MEKSNVAIIAENKISAVLAINTFTVERFIAGRLSRPDYAIIPL